VIRIEIGERRFLLYLLLPHPLKMACLSPASRQKLDRINREVNEAIYSGQGAAAYDQIHRYAGEEQHEYPARQLIERAWAPDGYGRALELGAGSGYFTAMIARRAKSVTAVEPVPDMQRVLRERCGAEGLDNVEVIGGFALDFSGRVAEGSMDSALVIQSLHHFHRREEIFEALGRAVRPGGRLFLLEPHHNLRRVARLAKKFARTYRAPEFWKSERNWATHDFLTRGELRALCRHGGFDEPRVRGYWIPYSRRLVPDAKRRFAIEDRLGRVPMFRHFAGVLALDARRGGLGAR
jgi:SAM-dependent methyltransferase